MIRDRKVLVHYFVSYLLILFIPLILGFAIYNRTVSILKDEEKEASFLVLNHSKNTLDSQLKQVEDLVIRLSIHPGIDRFLDRGLPLDDDSYYRITELLESLQRYSFNDALVLDFFIYFKNSDTMLTSKTAYHGEADYNSFYKYGDLSYGDYIDMVLQGGKSFLPPETAKFERTRMRTIAYVNPLGSGTATEPAGALVVYLNAEAVSSLLASLSDYSQGEAYIFNDKGEIMAASNEAADFDYNLLANQDPWEGHIFNNKGNYYVSYVNSAYTNWKHVAVISEKVLLAKALYVQKFTIWISLAAMLIGGIVALLLSYRQSKPIRELVGMIRNHSRSAPVKDVFASIKSSFHELSVSNEQLKGITERQTLQFRHVFFEKLIAGSFKNENEITAFGKQAQLALQARRYAWIVVEFKQYGVEITEEVLQQIQFNKFVFTNLSADLLGITHPIYDISEWKTCCLYLSDHEGEAELKEELRLKLEQLILLLTTKFKLSVRIAIGQPLPSLLDCWSSYHETQTALERVETNKIGYTAEIRLSNDIYYPTELEIQLVNAVKAGEIESAERIWGKIEEENFVKRVLTPVYRKLLLNELKASLTKVADPPGLTPEQAEADDFQTIRTALISIAKSNEYRKKTQYSDVAAEMLAYLRRHYGDPNLSLTSLSAVFNISESYISLLFKEYANDNFSTCLEDIRITHACALLLDTDQTIQNIAALTGYNSDKTFRRAFKRVKGVQPTAYREMKGLI